ncbi:unnamed protein product [Anisakis simplex]|uniref:Coatomer_WDAD domain-containing protein n=1 Tax=Anisakis simplex TaxID=6269 RepID=A0A0M3JUA1_ANISI|nr:unnamed protein product [Anisakis simplex]
MSDVGHTSSYTLESATTRSSEYSVANEDRFAVSVSAEYVYLAIYSDITYINASESGHLARVRRKWDIPEWLNDVREVLYVESNNTMIFRYNNGSIAVVDASFENSAPLASAKYNSPNAQVFYDKQNGVMVFLDERNICFRREHSGMFLIKGALTVQDKNKATISIEIPAEEVCAFLKCYSQFQFLKS